MSSRELVRYRVLTLVLEGQLALQDAAGKLGLSARQVRRLAQRVESHGPAGLVHGNRNRPPSNRTPEPLRERVVAWAEGPYAECNDSHLVELLAEREGIVLGRETVRALLRSAGRPPKRRRRPRRHHRRRERSPAKGLMMLWDGSPHRWLGLDRPPITLMAAVDDADGELLAAWFTSQETSEAYLHLLRQVLLHHGIPVSVYQDRHSCLRRNDESWSLEEQLAGRQSPTQVGMALEALGIQPIFAQSPQAKGRIERLFGVLQDRLLAELQLHDINSIEQANQFLASSGIARYNHRFRKVPTTPHSAFRPIDGVDLHKILAFRYRATVLNDNTVRLGGLVVDIPPGPRGRSYAKAIVDARQHLDGSWSVYYQDHPIAKAPASPLAEPLKYRSHKSPKQRTKAAHKDLLLYLPNQPTPGTFSLGS